MVKSCSGLRDDLDTETPPPPNQGERTGVERVPERARIGWRPMLQITVPARDLENEAINNHQKSIFTLSACTYRWLNLLFITERHPRLGRRTKGHSLFSLTRHKEKEVLEVIQKSPSSDGRIPISDLPLRAVCWRNQGTAVKKCCYPNLMRTCATAE